MTRTSSLTVLLSLAPPDGTTRYVDQLVEGRAEAVRLLFFSWGAALFGRYDVLHVHWPEYLLRSPTAPGRLIRSWLLRLLLLRLGRRQRAPWRPALVRTLHNLAPHETGSTAETRLLSRLDGRTDLWILLNDAHPCGGARRVLIPHGHYRGRYPEVGGAVRQPGRLLYFGLIRPYKGVDALLAAFSALADPSLSLRLVGRPITGWRELVEAACQRDPRITARLEFVADAVLAEEVQRAELVVLPFRKMVNSGTILVALSLDRPVLVPRTPVNELLAQEVGSGWIHVFEGPIRAEHLREALEAVRARPPASPPCLNDRDWASIGQRHLEAYQLALGRRDSYGASSSSR